MKVQADQSQIVPAQATKGLQSGVPNEHRWLNDLERAWLNNWNSERPAAPSPAAAKVSSETAVSSDVGRVPMSGPASSGGLAVSLSELQVSAFSGGGGLPQYPVWGVPARAQVELMNKSSDIERPVQPQQAMNEPVTTSVEKTQGAEPSPSTFAGALNKTELLRGDLLDPGVLRVVMTDAAVQANLCDPKLDVQAAMITGQNILQQLRQLGFSQASVYVNGVEFRNPRPSRDVASYPVLPEQEK
jgi:hypothetical protein